MADGSGKIEFCVSGSRNWWANRVHGLRSFDPVAKEIDRLGPILTMPTPIDLTNKPNRHGFDRPETPRILN
jgi:hypothetical protein